DVAVERELDDDLRLPEARRGRHVVDPGDRRELLLARRRDRRRHRLRARPRQRRAHRDRREVDVRQVGYGQLPVRNDSEHEDADHDKRGHDRSFYEYRGECHLSKGSKALALEPKALAQMNTDTIQLRRTWRKQSFGFLRLWPSVSE